jgi:hypothetical protein
VDVLSESIVFSLMIPRAFSNDYCTALTDSWDTVESASITKKGLLCSNNLISPFY